LLLSTNADDVLELEMKINNRLSFYLFDANSQILPHIVAMGTSSLVFMNHREAAAVWRRQGEGRDLCMIEMQLAPCSGLNKGFTIITPPTDPKKIPLEKSDPFSHTEACMQHNRWKIIIMSTMCSICWF